MGCKPCCINKKDMNNTIDFSNNIKYNLKSPIKEKRNIDSSIQVQDIKEIKHENYEKMNQNNYKFYYEILEQINLYRKKHNVNPLIINNDINILAQKHSDKIARENYIDLSYNKYEGVELGEIIFTFNEKYSPEKIIISFYEEESHTYNYKNKKPKPSNFTQIIWKSTKSIGIGCSKTKNNTIYCVIDFYPPGNINNEFLSNVFPPIDDDKKSSLSSNNSEIKIHFLEDLLNTNNEYRTKHKAQILNLNPYLTTKANEYAKLMADNNNIIDKEIEYLGEKCGKNICIKNNKKYDGQEVCDEWYNEINEYNFLDIKNNDKEKVKNFTQLVWKDTTEVGFGWAQSNQGIFYIVGIYYPSGNIEGKYMENVFPEEEL